MLYPPNENNDSEQDLAASPPSSPNAPSSLRFTASSTRVNSPPADAAALDGAGPSPPVAMTEAATFDKDVTAIRGEGGLHTTGRERIHHDEGLPVFWPKAVAGESGDSSPKKTAIPDTTAATDDAAMLDGEDNMGDDENIIGWKKYWDTESDAPMSADSAAAATSHDGGHGQLSSATVSQQETSATVPPSRQRGNDHGRPREYRRQRQQQVLDVRGGPPPQSISAIPNDEESITSSPLPALEGMLVQNVEATIIVENNEPVYEAVNISNSEVEQADQPCWKRYKKRILVGLIIVVFGVIAGAMGSSFGGGVDGDGVNMPTSKQTPLPTSPAPPTSPPTSIITFPVSYGLTPPNGTQCFANGDELKSAVNQYIDEGCRDNNECEVEKKYGWPMNSWCLSEVTQMFKLFHGKSGFNENISSWDVSSAVNMWWMFDGASSFNGDISSWNVSNVSDMQRMFVDASFFNGDISSWNVSSVSNTAAMFRGASSFNGDISSWNVSNVSEMENMFFDASSFNGDISSWNVSSVSTMQEMFSGAFSFNGDMSHWNILNVSDMKRMFKGASSFNGDISSWNVSSVSSMKSMFHDAFSFNGDISSWHVSNGTDTWGMFEGASSFNGNISFEESDFFLGQEM